MDRFDSETLAVACVTAVACSLTGSFLFLLKKTMQVEAIGHSVLLGIVLVFLVGFGESLVALFLGCMVSGIVTLLIGSLFSPGMRHNNPVVLALVFPGVFAIALILINVYLRNSHVDTHVILMGELAMAAFLRVEIGGHDYGPQALWKSGCALFAAASFLILFGHKASVFAFDPTLALTKGYNSKLIHCGFLILVCICAVAAFDVVGSIATLALFSVPPAAAFFWAGGVRTFQATSAVLAFFGTTAGFFAAKNWDFSMAGCISVALGIVFFVSVFFGNERGICWLRFWQ
jgi:manganese/zinc/iron transport system permease protein